MPVPFSVISSVAEFQAVFAPQRATTTSSSSSSPPPPPPPSSSSSSSSSSHHRQWPRDSLILCYEVPSDGITAAGLQSFRDAVDAEAARHSTAIALHLWDCSSAAFKAAKEQLEKIPGAPLLLIMFDGAIADTVRDAALPAVAAERVPRICERLAAFQRTSRPAQVMPSTSTTTTTNGDDGTSAGGRVMRVDVARIMNLGQSLLTKGEAVYAEKAFVKAIAALQALEADVMAASARTASSSSSSVSTAVADYEGSMAMALAWAALSQIVQGKVINNNPFLKTLTGGSGDRFLAYTEEPLSDACRVVTTQQLMLAAPRAWTVETCSQKKLGEALRSNPSDHDSRAMLVITLFLAGDMERALTEAVKLRSLGIDYGRIALKKIAVFLGPDHTLVGQLGPLTSTLVAAAKEK